MFTKPSGHLECLAPTALGQFSIYPDVSRANRIAVWAPAIIKYSATGTFRNGDAKLFVRLGRGKNADWRVESLRIEPRNEGPTMKKVCLAAFAGLLFTTSTVAALRSSASCDKECLLKTADTYLAALVAHDASKAPMTANAKFTEQTKELKVGDGGLWKSAISVSTTYSIPVADPVSQQIGMLVMLKADAKAWPAPPARGNAPAPDANAPADIQLALRLKVVDRKITEAEHIIARISAPSQLNALKTPRAAFAQTVPKAQRAPRNILLLIGNSYYDALTQNNGELAPFADDCGRRENGMHTAGAGRPADAPPPPAGFGDTPTDCAGQLTSRAMSYITSIDLRRVTIADEERGLVFGLTMFRQTMEQKTITILQKDGTMSERPMNFAPFDLEAAHIFKIYGDKIHEIEAMGFTLPLYSKNGWYPFTK
jgi:hypothetical protein